MLPLFKICSNSYVASPTLVITCCPGAFNPINKLELAASSVFQDIFTEFSVKKTTLATEITGPEISGKLSVDVD